MPRPNRVERRLHWRIELVKLLWGTLVVMGAGLLALSRTELRFTWPWSWEAWIMVGGIIGFLVLVVASALALSAVIWTIRALPDE